MLKIELSRKKTKFELFSMIVALRKRLLLVYFKHLTYENLPCGLFLAYAFLEWFIIDSFWLYLLNLVGMNLLLRTMAAFVGLLI